MLVMGLDSVYSRSIKHLESVHFKQMNRAVSIFEASIRFLGGLLGAYTFTGDSILLQKAKEVGDILKHAFDTPSGIPHNSINSQTLQGFSSFGPCLVDAGGSVQLEFAYLSHLTGNPEYVDKGLRAWQVIKPHKRPDNLYGNFVNVMNGMIVSNEVSIGSFGDSFYEYVFKYYLLTNETNSDIRNWFFDMGDSIVNIAVKYEEDSYYIPDLFGDTKTHKMQHLTCFVGGLLALAADYLPESKIDKRENYLNVAKGVGKFCKLMYEASPTKLSAETYNVYGNSMSVGTRYWIMRPEAVESWFILYRKTGDPKYRQWTWELYEAIQKTSWAKFGYSGLNDATFDSKDNVQQSFFFGGNFEIYVLDFYTK